MYTYYTSSSHRVERIDELVGKQLLSDTPKDMPCNADMLIDIVYCFTEVSSVAFPCHSEVTSLAKPYSSEFSSCPMS